MAQADEATWRLFVALPVPRQAGADVVEALRPYAARHATARWLRPDALHVTLLFLGALPARHVPELSSIVDELAGGATAQDLTTGAGAGRVRGDDGVAWLTLASGVPGVATLSRDLLERVPPDLLGGGQGTHLPPAPHLTVARRATQPLVDDLSAQRLGRLAVAWRADRVCLFRSRPSLGAASYEALHAAWLGSRP